MGLLIVRHGDAGLARNDIDRTLSSSGAADIKHAAAFLTTATYAADCCLVSPYIRTQQTLKILGSQIQLGSIVTTSTLAPEAEVVDSLAEIEAAYHGELAIISHQPLVSKLLAWCLTGDSYDLQLLPLPPGAMAYVEMGVFGAGCGRLLWLRLPPDYTVNLR